MSQFINYPKSSCNCYNCEQKNYTIQNQGIPTNMSVYNCEFPEYLDCTLNQAGFKSDIEPSEKIGYEYINPQVYTQKYAQDFELLNCNSANASEYVPLPNGWLQPCEGRQVITNDPRLNSASHGQWITLDQPPIDSSMKLYDIPFDKRLDKYGQNYNSYSDINAGQIVYYIDKSEEDPMSEPVYSISAKVDSYLYQDPMGGISPYYYRTPLKNDNPIGPKRNNYDGGLSWMQDSLNQREEIMMLQSTKINKSDWLMRYRK